MKQYLLDVEVEHQEEGGFLAIARNLQGAHAEGETIAEAIENLEDVARIMIELCREKGLPLPTEFTGAEQPPLIKAEVFVRVEA